MTVASPTDDVGVGSAAPVRAPGWRTVLFVAMRQLWGRKLLHGIALAGVALGVLTLVTMNGVLQGFEQKFRQSILKISPHVTLDGTELHRDAPLLAHDVSGPAVGHVAHESPRDRPGRIKRPLEIVRALRELPEVEAASASLAGTVLVEYGGASRPVDLRGVDIVEQERVTPISVYTQAGTFRTLSVATRGLALGSGVAEEFGVKVDDVVHAAAPGGPPLDLKIVAIYETGVPPVDKARGYALLRTAQALLGRPDQVDRIEVRLRDPDDARRFTGTVERIFGYDAESWQEANANSLSLFVMQSVIANLVIGAILVVGGFGILAVQTMIVLQKRRDIAVLRSVGFRRADILRIFLLQGVLVALAGGITGDLLGKVAITELGGLRVHSETMVKTDTFLIWEDPRFYLWGLLFALVIGVVASLVPAWRASKVEPVDVLRGQIG